MRQGFSFAAALVEGVSGLVYAFTGDYSAGAGLELLIGLASLVPPACYLACQICSAANASELPETFEIEAAS